MLKSNCTQSEPKILRKRNHSNFREELFRRYLKEVLKDDCNFNFNDDFSKTLDVHTPVKIAKLRGNTFPANIYLLKVNNRYTRTRSEICSKLTIKIPERRQWRRAGIFFFSFEHISRLVLVFLLLTLNM